MRVSSCFTSRDSYVTGHTYSPNGRYLAVAERHSGKDHIGVYDTTAQYQLIRVSRSLTAILWPNLTPHRASHCRRTTCRASPGPRVGNGSQPWTPISPYVIRSPPIFKPDHYFQFSMYIHSPIGPLLSHFSPTSPGFSPTSTSTSTLSTEDPGLGIRTTAWAPGGRFIAVGGWDGKVRVLESDGWRCVAVMTWGTRTVEKNAVSLYADPWENRTDLT